MTVPLPSILSPADAAQFNTTVAPYLVQAPQWFQFLRDQVSVVTGGGRVNVAELQTLYYQSNPAVTALTFALAIAPIFVLVALITGNYSQVDRFWSILPTLYNVHYALWARRAGLDTARLDSVALLSLAWGARLTFNYARKGGYKFGSEDYRLLEIELIVVCYLLLSEQPETLLQRPRPLKTSIPSSRINQGNRSIRPNALSMSTNTRVELDQLAAQLKEVLTATNARSQPESSQPRQTLTYRSSQAQESPNPKPAQKKKSIFRPEAEVFRPSASAFTKDNVKQEQTSESAAGSNERVPAQSAPSQQTPPELGSTQAPTEAKESQGNDRQHSSAAASQAAKPDIENGQKRDPEPAADDSQEARDQENAPPSQTAEGDSISKTQDGKGTTAGYGEPSRPPDVKSPPDGYPAEDSSANEKGPELESSLWATTPADEGAKRSDNKDDDPKARKSENRDETRNSDGDEGKLPPERVMNELTASQSEAPSDNTKKSNEAEETDSIVYCFAFTNPELFRTIQRRTTPPFWQDERLVLRPEFAPPPGSDIRDQIEAQVYLQGQGEESESEDEPSSEDDDDQKPLATRFSEFKEMIQEALALADDQFEKGSEKFVEKFMLSGEPYRVLLEEVKSRQRKRNGLKIWGRYRHPATMYLK
ncbi:hypothetical protein VTN31DRAFT_3953 [Thermomyces dupontii]|uniref:uncharacterized protein n=1 Tax=Talaromyces thermophilus TaxID=28565 RepID=UPI0037426CD0